MFFGRIIAGEYIGEYIREGIKRNAGDVFTVFK